MPRKRKARPPEQQMGMARGLAAMSDRTTEDQKLAAFMHTFHPGVISEETPVYDARRLKT